MKHNLELAQTDPLLLVAVPAGVTGFLFLTSSNEVNFEQGAIAFALLLIPWFGYLRWKTERRSGLPLYAMIAFAYWVYYGVPLFWEDRNALNAGSASFKLTGEAATQVLTMVILGVVSMGLGMRTRFGRALVPKNPPEMNPTSKNWTYVRVVFAATMLFSMEPRLPYLLGEEGRQLILIVQRDIPLVAFALLFRRFVRREAVTIDKIFVGAFLVLRFYSGMSSVWLGTFVGTMVICVLVYVSEARKIPRSIIVLGLFFVLFFQVSKSTVRQKYWYEKNEASQAERVEYWAAESFKQWEKALSGSTTQSHESVTNLARQSVSRLSLMNQTANVMTRTPSEVPYQYGALYSYMVVGLVPRAVWPGKPSVNEANQFYQVAYGLTAENRLDSVSIAVGTLAEAYINFGWFGAIFIMFLLGMLFDFLQRTFLSKDSGLLFTAIGLLLVPDFLTIESQMAQYVSGVMQRVVIILIVMYPILLRKKKKLSMISAGADRTANPESAFAAQDPATVTVAIHRP
jgi:hypothetical protein